MTVILDQFLHTLSESGLMTAEEVQQVIQSLPDDQKPQSGEDLAKLLYSQGKLTKFQAQAIYQGKTKGLVLGNYVVLDKIGQGGMGHVYKAEHRRMKRQVALKVLPSALTKEQEAVQRFQREVQAAAKLSHPNIVTAYDADEADGVHFLVMEHVEGDDLAKRVHKHGPLSVGDAVDYVLQAAKGLQCAHEAGIVHRDIKPSNLLINQSGNVKVLDMGLARLEEKIGQESTTAAAALTQTGQVMGTIDYMPPEQVESTHRVDHRADIYSLGCTLFCLLMGRPVYSGDSVTARALAHREQSIPSLHELRQDVPEKLDAVFQKMAAKRPEDRHASMTEVITELEACQKALQEPVQDTLSTGGGPTGGGDTERYGADALALEMEKPAGAGSSADDWLQEELPKAPTLLRTKPQPQAKAVNRPVIVASVAAALAFLLLLAGVIFMIRTPRGTVVVQVDQPDAEISVDGGKITLRRPGDDEAVEVEVAEGPHTLKVTKDGFETHSEEFTVKSGDRQVFHVRLAPLTAEVPKKPKTADISEAKAVANSDALVGRGGGSEPATFVESEPEPPVEKDAQIAGVPEQTEDQAARVTGKSNSAADGASSVASESLPIRGGRGRTDLPSSDRGDTAVVAGRSSPGSSARVRWLKNSGLDFQQLRDGTWRELSENGKTYTFTEARRTPDFVELDGRSEPWVTYRLFKDKALISRRGSTYTNKYVGRWSDD